tara:strand:- start:93146 stop:93307 length:162 start_codon:yes stop_codon:yes gene_type:complete
MKAYDNGENINDPNALAIPIMDYIFMPAPSNMAKDRCAAMRIANAHEQTKDRT